jgi:hypothetical protein
LIVVPLIITLRTSLYRLHLMTINHATFTDELENLGIGYNIALIPFFKEKQDLSSFPDFVDRIKNCKVEIALHGLYHENTMAVNFIFSRSCDT